MQQSSGVGRRAVLLAGVPVVGSLAGCLGGIAGGSGPQERTYEVTITRSGGTLQASVDPSGDTAGVVQVNVGDTVTFDVTNEAGVPVGVHNHATDEEVVVEAGGSTTMEFEAVESMTGRHELEGYVAEGTEGGHSEGTEGNHSEGTAEGAEGGHGGETTPLIVIEVRPRGA